MSATSWQQVVVMEFGKQHNTTDFCPRQLVTDLLFMLWTCCGLAAGSRQFVTDLLLGKWCNGYWPLSSSMKTQSQLWYTLKIFFETKKAEHVVVQHETNDHSIKNTEAK